MLGMRPGVHVDVMLGMPGLVCTGDLVCHWCGLKYMSPGMGFPATLSSGNFIEICFLCWACDARQFPPHNQYLDKIFGKKRLGGKHLTDLISQFAYAVCSHPGTECSASTFIVMTVPLLWWGLESTGAVVGTREKTMAPIRVRRHPV